MPGIHHPTAPPDPEAVAPHPRESCDRDRCGMAPWRVEDQSAYKVGYSAGWRDAVAAMIAADNDDRGQQ